MRKQYHCSYFGCGVLLTKENASPYALKENACDQRMCKACNALRARKQYANNPNKKTYMKVYAKTEKAIDYQKDYWAKPKNRKRRAERQHQRYLRIMSDPVLAEQVRAYNRERYKKRMAVGA